MVFATVAIVGSVRSTIFPSALGIQAGDSVKVSFPALTAAVDRIATDGSGVHLDDGIKPYLICNESFAMSFGKVTGVMGKPLPVVPPSDDTFFSLMSKRPVNDGIFVSTKAGAPTGLPMNLKGGSGANIEELYKGPFNLDLSFNYRRGTVPSLELGETAKKTFTQDGLLSSSFRLSTGWATNYVLDVKLESIEIHLPSKK